MHEDPTTRFEFGYADCVAQSSIFVQVKNHTPHTWMFKKTLTRYLENYAGFSEANITQKVVGRGSCVSPQQFAVLLTPALSLVLAFYSLN